MNFEKHAADKKGTENPAEAGFSRGRDQT